MEESAFLAALPVLAFQAVLAFARLGAAAMVLPGLGEEEVPTAIRLGLGLVLLLPGIAPGLPQAPDSAAEAVRVILIEVLVGLWLGGLARLVVMAMAVAGQAIALLLGLAQAMVPDPMLGGLGTAPGRLLSLAAVVVVFSTGLYAIPLRALAESYTLLPPGDPFPAGESLALSLRLAAPFVVAAIIINVALGLLARIAPQVQVYFVAIPGQVLLGLALTATGLACGLHPRSSARPSRPDPAPPIRRDVPSARRRWPCRSASPLAAAGRRQRRKHQCGLLQQRAASRGAGWHHEVEPPCDILVRRQVAVILQQPAHQQAGESRIAQRADPSRAVMRAQQAHHHGDIHRLRGLPGGDLIPAS
jgi:flagellar biosynthetic protein FliR